MGVSADRWVWDKTNISVWGRQAPQYSPVRALVESVPAEGAPRYDFLRQLIKGMTAPGPAAAKYDPLWDLLHAAKEQGLPGLSPHPLTSPSSHKSVAHPVSVGSRDTFRHHSDMVGVRNVEPQSVILLNDRCIISRRHLLPI